MSAEFHLIPPLIAATPDGSHLMVCISDSVGLFSALTGCLVRQWRWSIFGPAAPNNAHKLSFAPVIASRGPVILFAARYQGYNCVGNFVITLESVWSNVVLHQLPFGNIADALKIQIPTACVVVDTPTGSIVAVADSQLDRLALYNLHDWSLVRYLGAKKAATDGSANFTNPCALATTDSGLLIVGEAHQIKIITLLGETRAILKPSPRHHPEVGGLGRYLHVLALDGNAADILVTSQSSDWNTYTLDGMAVELKVSELKVSDRGVLQSAALFSLPDINVARLTSIVQAAHHVWMVESAGLGGPHRVCQFR